MRQGAGRGDAAVKALQTRAELDAIVRQRSELRDQLRILEDRRTQLSAQRRVSEQSQRGVLDQRIQALDERIPRIEREILQADEVIAKGVGRTGVLEPPPAIPPTENVAVIPGGFASPELGVALERVLVVEGFGFVLIGFVAWRSLRRLERRLTGTGPDAGHAARLQQSVDSIAVEVERISENQRYVTKLLAAKAPELGAGEVKK
jgi:hypothetical protein